MMQGRFCKFILQQFADSGSPSLTGLISSAARNPIEICLTSGFFFQPLGLRRSSNPQEVADSPGVEFYS